MGLQGSGNSSENFVKLQGYTRAHPRCLFLFDNADDLSIVEEYLPSIPSLHILVTTRRSFVDSPRLGGARIHGLEPFKSDVGVRLLLKIADYSLSVEQLRCNHFSEYEHALKIVGPEMLDGLPLGIFHAGQKLKRQRGKHAGKIKALWETLDRNRVSLSITPKSVKEWLRNYHLSEIYEVMVENLHLGKLDDIRKPLAESTIKESSLTSHIKQAVLDAREDLLHHPSIGPWKMDIVAAIDAKNICRYLVEAISLLPSRGISVSFLRSHLQELKEEECQEEFEDAMHELTDRSLLTYSENSDTLAVHPLIQQTFQQCVIDQKKRKEVLSLLSSTLVSVLPLLHEIRTGNKLCHKNVMNYSSHLYHVASLILDCTCESLECLAAVDLACSLSIHLHNITFGESLCMLRLSLARRAGDKERLIQGDLL